MTRPGFVAVDTSVALALTLRSHDAHEVAVRWSAGRALLLCGHAAVETYSVMTRYPGDARFRPLDAVAVINDWFAGTVIPPEDAARRIPQILAEAGVFGGAVYDGLVALTALHHDLPLATRDRRARPTYAALGVQVITVI